jgi:hypothetical protein
VKAFNNYQLYAVLHPEDCAPSFAAVTKTAIRVLKPEGKCGRATREDLENGVINDRTESTDVVAEIDLATLLTEGMEAGLPCLKGLLEIVHPMPEVGQAVVVKGCQKGVGQGTVLDLDYQGSGWVQVQYDEGRSKCWFALREIKLLHKESSGAKTTKQADEILCKGFREKILPPISVSSADPTSTEALINISRIVDSTKVAKRLFYELAALYQKHKPDLRRGQCVFNLMHHVHPVQACKYSGSDIDPFHDNSKIRVFVDTCYKEAKKKRGKK